MPDTADHDAATTPPASGRRRWPWVFLALAVAVTVAFAVFVRRGGAQDDAAPRPLSVTIEQDAQAVRVVLTNPNHRHRFGPDRFSVMLFGDRNVIIRGYLDGDPMGEGFRCCRLDGIDPGQRFVIVLPPSAQPVQRAEVNFFRPEPEWIHT